MKEIFLANFDISTTFVYFIV